jgi:dipeptidyl aminopeptidase/acylaminoacyl peptidase
LAGVYDFVPIEAKEKDMIGMFGKTPAEQRRAQPVSFVHGDEPPMLLLHGTADHEVDPSNSKSLARAMQAKNEDVTLKLYRGVGHSALLFSMSRPMREHAPTLDDVLAFIHAHGTDATNNRPPLSSFLRGREPSGLKFLTSKGPGSLPSQG